MKFNIFKLKKIFMVLLRNTECSDKKGGIFKYCTYVKTYLENI